PLLCAAPLRLSPLSPLPLSSLLSPLSSLLPPLSSPLLSPLSSLPLSLLSPLSSSSSSSSSWSCRRRLPCSRAQHAPCSPPFTPLLAILIFFHKFTISPHCWPS